MNMLAQAPLTMSSREISDLVDARHDNVVRTIDRLAERGVIVRPPLEDEPSTDAMGRLRITQVYRLEKRDSFVVVAQLSPEFTARLVDRWQELEARPQVDPMALLSDPAALRGLLAGYAERVVELQGEVEEMRPQVQALERIALSDGSLCITDAAKTLGVAPKLLFRHLRGNGWIYSRGGGAEVAYQDKLASGLLEHKVTTVHRTDGSERTATQVRVTAKGLTRLAREVGPGPLFH